MTKNVLGLMSQICLVINNVPILMGHQCKEVFKLGFGKHGVNDFQAQSDMTFGGKKNSENYSIDMEYDANGNMTLDKNKQISGVSYNYLNLPDQIDLEQDEMKHIFYAYDALGTKLQKTTYGTGYLPGPATDYCGSFVYSDGNLQFAQHAEGRLVPRENGGFDYQYYLKDHLGNTRITLSQNGTILQEDAYYPYGMNITGLSAANSSPENRYKYNGKELEGEFGLDWYDYGARFYDPSIGGFPNIDPMAELRTNLSPYNYCSLNPINRIDPDGALDDNYSVDKDGNIKKEEDTDDEYDMVFTKEDWDSGNIGQDNTNTARIEDQEILPQLVDNQEVNQEDANGTVTRKGSLRTTTSSSKKDMTNLFAFVAKNTDVEWSLYNTENKMFLGTYGWDDLSPGANQYGIDDSNILSMVHSHPNPVSFMDEKESLYGDKRVALKVNYKYFTYMKNSRNLYLLNNSANPGKIKLTPNVSKRGLHKKLTDN